MNFLRKLWRRIFKHGEKHSVSVMPETKKTKGDAPLILIIEDENLLSRMYSKKLENDGYRFAVANNGKDGLELAIAKKPNLIICDVMMPQVDGLTVLKQLKSNSETENIPVIMLSNLAEEKYVNEAITLGAAGYLVKSELLPSQVVNKVKEVLIAA